MDIVRKIINCQTVAELCTLENLYVLEDYEQGLVYERKTEIITRLAEWSIENEQHGLTANLTDSWTPERREQFFTDWNNDEWIWQVDEGINNDGGNSVNETMDEPTLQTGRGQKRAIDQVYDGVNERDSTSEQVSDNNYYTMTTAFEDSFAKRSKGPSRKLLIAMAKKKGIIYASIMNKKQLHRVISLNEQDPTILCLPEVENSRNNYRENHREEARETSRRWRLKNPEKSAAHWARRKDLTEIGLLNWGVRKCDRVPGECWKTTPSKPANLTE